MTIFDEIKAERQYQDKRWGHELDDRLNTPFHWVAYITQYATKWMAGTWPPFGRDTTDDFRKMMIKVAAIAVAAIESLDRQRVNKGNAFYE